MASRQLLEIAQFTHDIRYKPGKLNLTADQMSRPHGVPPGDAYCPQIDSVASLKELPNITPTEIIHHQAQSKQTELFMQGVKNPKNEFEYVPFDDVRLLCESSGPEPHPFIPDTLQQKSPSAMS